MSEDLERKVTMMAQVAGEVMERSGMGTWKAVYKVFWFKDLEEWCVCPTYIGYEWLGDPKPIAVFQSIELASAFTRVLNQCGVAWVVENRHSLEVDFPGGEVVK